MRLTKVPAPGGCEVIEAEFVFGPLRCATPAHWQTEYDGDLFFVCDDHIAVQRRTEVAS